MLFKIRRIYKLPHNTPEEFKRFMQEKIKEDKLALETLSAMESENPHEAMSLLSSAHRSKDIIKRALELKLQEQKKACQQS